MPLFACKGLIRQEAEREVVSGHYMWGEQFSIDGPMFLGANWITKALYTPIL